jgi:hypothetical protein
MARPEQRIHGVIVECGGCMDAGRGARTIPCVIDHAGSWERAGDWLLVVIVTLSEGQSVEAWLAGSLSSSSANSI